MKHPSANESSDYSLHPAWIAVLIIVPILAIGLGVAFVTKAPKPVEAANPEVATFSPPSHATNPPIQASTYHIPTLTPSPTFTVSPTTAVFGSVSGAAWIQTKGGETLVQRGLHIWIVRPKISTQGTINVLKEAIPRWNKMIVSYKEMAGAGAGDDNSNLITAKDYASRVARFETFLSKPSELIETTVAYSLSKESNVHGRSSFGISASLDHLTEGKTDVDGKYDVENIPAGSYYLYAAIDTELIFVDWLIPITVGNERVKLDLDSDNATTVENFSP